MVDELVRALLHLHSLRLAFSGSRATSSNFQKLHSAMDRMVDEQLHSFQSIKKAMLEHDRLFKQQVKELHRLYGVQKMLMNEVKHKLRISPQSRGCGVDSTRLADRHDLSTEVARGYSLTNAQVLKSFPGFKEASVSCSGENLTQPGRSDLEKPVYEVNTASSFYRKSYDEEEEAGVELTLSIVGNAKSSNKRMEITQQPHGSNKMDLPYSKSLSDHFELKEKNGSSSASAVEELPGPREECSSYTATSDEDRKRPHWLFRSLSSLPKT